MANPVNWNNVPMLTPGMKNLGNQINAWDPDRDGASDGAIGDYAHTQEHSGHNPDDTSENNAEWDGDADNVKDVRAIDVDISFSNGVSAQTLVDHIVGLKPSSVLRYVIYNRHIWKSTNNWQREDYTGASAHTEHIHFSGAYSESADQNTSYNYKLGDIPVALTSADKAWIADQIAGIAADVWATKIGNANWPNRTAKQAVNDFSTLRDALVDPNITLDEANIVDGVPFTRILDAADQILAPDPS
jgi:hypothetical protein